MADQQTPDQSPQSPPPEKVKPLELEQFMAELGPEIQIQFEPHQLREELARLPGLFLKYATRVIEAKRVTAHTRSVLEAEVGKEREKVTRMANLSGQQIPPGMQIQVPVTNEIRNAQIAFAAAQQAEGMWITAAEAVQIKRQALADLVQLVTKSPL